MALEQLSFLTRVLVSFCMTLLHALRILSDYVAYPAFSFFKSGRSKLMPRLDDQILLMSAADLAEQIRYGKVINIGWIILNL